MTDVSLNQSCKIQWTKDVLLHHFLPLYNLIHQHPSASGFMDEVDAEALGIPDYYKVIKHPIALCNIFNKLNGGEYKDPWMIVNDFWLMFNNCLYFNRKSTQIYGECLQLIDFFTEHASVLMKNLGYCCANLYYYEPKLKQCSTVKACLIKTNDVYYRANSPQAEFLVCNKCFTNCKDVVQITELNKINKDLFVQLKNDVREEETFVKCNNCQRNWHTVCVLYRDCGDFFLCPQCQPSDKKINWIYNSDLIPASELSYFIERQVNDALRVEDPNVSNIVIRDFMDNDNKIAYLNKIKEKYNITESPPYTLRAIYAFTKIDGIDIMFFGLHVQEFSSDIEGPNKGCVSITYLDSVSYFEPRHLKTKLYHQILLSYLDYTRRKGMTQAHLWVCPPETGNDYIFHRHPAEQKLPKKDRLKLWYEAIFEKGIEQSIVSKYEDLAEYYKNKCVTKPTDLAYFDGDFWPGEIETLLTELDKEVKSRLNSSGKICRKRKRKQKDVSLLFDIDNLDGEINNRLTKLLNKWGEDFIVVTLVDMKIKLEETVSSNRSTDWVCEILETRDKFLPFCKDFNLEFSTLRRVKYATMRILNEVFRENNKYKFFCNHCHRKNIHVRYYCKRCLDFDLCENCYLNNTHEHELFKEEAAPQELSLDQLSELVGHAFVCMEQDCSVSRCRRMKDIKRHFENCNSSECKLCKEACAAFLNHTKKCNVEECNVFTCVSKNKSKKPAALAVTPQTLPKRPVLNNSVNQSPLMHFQKPLSTSTPNFRISSSELLDKQKRIIMAKIMELKGKYNDDKPEINRRFSEFMKSNTQLREAYFALNERPKTIQENTMRENTDPNVQVRTLMPVIPRQHQSISENVYRSNVHHEQVHSLNQIKTESSRDHFEIRPLKPLTNIPHPIRIIKPEPGLTINSTRIVPNNPTICIKMNMNKQIKIDPTNSKVFKLTQVYPNQTTKTVRIETKKPPEPDS